MNITKTNHWVPNFIAKKWGLVDNKGTHHGKVCYYDEGKIIIGNTDRLVAGKKKYLPDTETFFRKVIETPFNRYLSVPSDDFNLVKSAVLLITTMGGRNPNRYGYSKLELDQKIKEIDWDLLTKVAMENRSFFFMKSKQALYLNQSGIFFLPHITTTSGFIYDEDCPIALPINQYTLLCTCKKLSEEKIMEYAKYTSQYAHCYSVGRYGKVILPVDGTKLPNLKKVPEEVKTELVQLVSSFRNNVVEAEVSVYEKINETLRNMGWEYFLKS